MTEEMKVWDVELECFTTVEAKTREEAFALAKNERANDNIDFCIKNVEVNKEMKTEDDE